MSTNSPLKNGQFPRSLTEGPDFATWKQETLAQVASEMYEKLREQSDEIMHLQQDLKTAIEAYRALIRLS